MLKFWTQTAKKNHPRHDQPRGDLFQIMELQAAPEIFYFSTGFGTQRPHQQHRFFPVNAHADNIFFRRLSLIRGAWIDHRVQCHAKRANAALPCSAQLTQPLHIGPSRYIDKNFFVGSIIQLHRIPPIRFDNGLDTNVHFLFKNINTSPQNIKIRKLKSKK